MKDSGIGEYWILLLASKMLVKLLLCENGNSLDLSFPKIKISKLIRSALSKTNHRILTVKVQVL